MKAQHICASIVLSISLALTSLEESALAEGVEGTQTNSNVIITSETAWTVLSSAIVAVTPGVPLNCVVTGSADAQNPGGGTIDNRYQFTISVNTTGPVNDSGCERTLQFDDNVGFNDIDNDHVTTTCLLRNISLGGNNTIRWLGRKLPKTPDAPNLTVLDNSLTVVCSESLQ